MSETPMIRSLANALTSAQEAYPTQRLGQIIENAIPAGKDLFYLENNELVAYLYLYSKGENK